MLIGRGIYPYGWISKMRMGKVFYSDGSGNARPEDPSIIPGWYYQIDLAAPVGPFESKSAAKSAARATLPGERDAS